MQNISKQKWKIYGLYTGVFACIAAVIFFQFLYYGKTLIEYHDSLQQYYAAFQYFVTYIHKVIRTFISTGQIHLPMWDFSIGMGGDVLTALNYYVIGDPINFIGVFFKTSQLEVIYQLLIIFRIYLAGFFFIMFCRKIGYTKAYTIAGAVIYCFSIFALYSAVMYAAFPNVLIYLPLLLIAIERVFRNQGGSMLMWVIALCMISNFYFCYMLAVIAVIYCLLRYFCVNYYFLKKQNVTFKDRLRDLFQCIGKMILPIIFGVLLSCVVLIPDLKVFVNQGRGAGQIVQSYTHYTVREYIELLSSLFSPKIAANYNLLGFCPIVFLALLLLFQKSCKKKRIKKVLRIAYVFSGIFLLIPFFGYALNGFAYINNRWIFGLVFLSAVTIVILFEELLHLNKKNKVVLCAGAIVYLVICLIVRQLKTSAVMTGVIWTFVFLSIILLLNGLKDLKEKRQICLMTMICGCVAFYGFSLFNPLDTSIMSSKLDAGQISNLKDNKTAGAVTKIKDSGFYRVDVTDGDTLNEGLLFGYPSVAFYYSLYDGKITEFNKELNNSAMTVPNLSHGNKGRSYLDNLCSVKYAVTNTKENAPYGFKLYKKQKNKQGQVRYIYKNKNSLPFGYTLNNYVSREKYETYTTLQKEQAMLQGAVLNKEDSGKLNEIEPQFMDSSLSYKIKNVKGAKVKKNKIIVEQRDATIEMEVEIPKGKEIFIQGKDIKFKAYSPSTTPQYYYPKKMTTYEKRLLDNQYKSWNEPSNVVITGQLGKKVDSTTMYQKQYKYFWNQDSFLLCLGNFYEGKQTISLKISEPGEYTYSDLSILTEDMPTMENQATQLKQNPMTNVKFASNYIEGTINTEGDELLVLSLPYSEGWSAKVDGKKADLVTVNTMWSGIYLGEQGKHKIKLHYRTPGLILGASISGVTLILVVVVLIFNKIKKRENK